MEEVLILKCSKCDIEYQKPADLKRWNEEKPNVLFSWSLKYCDNCRREKEREALKRLPEILKTLTIEE